MPALGRLDYSCECSHARLYERGAARRRERAVDDPEHGPVVRNISWRTNCDGKHDAVTMLLTPWRRVRFGSRKINPTTGGGDDTRDRGGWRLAAQYQAERWQRVFEANDGSWAVASGVRLCFIRPGRPVENGSIESFNGGFAMSASTWRRSAGSAMPGERWLCGANI